MLQKTYKLADLPPSSSLSMLNVLRHFTDRLGVPKDVDSSLDIAQLLKNVAIVQPDFSAIQTSPGPLDPELQGPDCAEAWQIARAMAAKIQRRMVPAGYDDLVNMEIRPLPLVFKPDGMERARERGAREIEGNFLTLDTTKQLINLVYDHLPHSMNSGCRVVTGIVLLRLAAVLSDDSARTHYLLTDVPIPSVQLDDNSTHIFGGVIDYVLTTYSATSQQCSPENTLKAPRFRKLGSANIFEMKSIGELTRGLPQCILATASWCHQSGSEAVMRGAATNGDFWIFFAYKRGTERSYYARTEIFYARNVSFLDWILGILIDWIENAGSCDVFEYFKTPSYD